MKIVHFIYKQDRIMDQKRTDIPITRCIKIPQNLFPHIRKFSWCPTNGERRNGELLSII